MRMLAWMAAAVLAGPACAVQPTPPTPPAPATPATTPTPATPPKPDTDLDALALADKAPDESGKAGDWQGALEVAMVRAAPRDGSAAYDDQRVALDLRLDKALAPGWRAVVSNRLDVFGRRTASGQHPVNTLKEASLSWQPTPERIVDIGRINVRQGVATGYNPTDFFKLNAVRAITSADPDTLRKNRLGSVMLRGQTLWDSGSLSALYSPKLGKGPNDAPFALDAGATNDRERWMFALSQKLSQRVSPQFSLYGEQGGAPQLGMNLTTLLGDATVLNVEWSGGRTATWQAEMTAAGTGATGPRRYANKVATGVTFTTRNKLSLTMEYEYNGWAPDLDGWASLRSDSLANYTRYRTLMRDRLELPTRHALFFYGTWQDAGLRNLNLTLMRRYNTDDHSGLAWAEARYHWKRADLAMQFQSNGGADRSEYGVLPDRRRRQMVASWYF